MSYRNMVSTIPYGNIFGVFWHICYLLAYCQFLPFGYFLPLFAFWLFLALLAHLENGPNFFMSHRNMEFTISYVFQDKIFVVFCRFLANFDSLKKFKNILKTDNKLLDKIWYFWRFFGQFGYFLATLGMPFWLFLTLRRT